MDSTDGAPVVLTVSGAQLAELLALHNRVDGTRFAPVICAAQCRDRQGTVQAWPCATRRLLDLIAPAEPE